MRCSCFLEVMWLAVPRGDASRFSSFNKPCRHFLDHLHPSRAAHQRRSPYTPYCRRFNKIKMVIQLKVHGPKGEEKIIYLCDSERQLRGITVVQLRDTITRELQISEDIRIIFRTEPLEEGSLLSSYGIRHMSTLHTVLKLKGGL